MSPALFRHPPSSILQAQWWPVLASGRDCIGIAETGDGRDHDASDADGDAGYIIDVLTPKNGDVYTDFDPGSGKTLAFTIPALVHLNHRSKEEGRAASGLPKMLIIAPTR